MAESIKVAVIGAGVSGLAVARELKREGHSVVVFEKSEHIGGTWAYDPRVESDPLSLDPTREIVHSSLYSSLRTNLPRLLMSFMDYPFRIRKGGDSRDFPGHEEVLLYLNDFARDFGILHLIRFNNEVIRVQLVGDKDDQWVVEWKNRGSESESEVFEAVVICSGHFTEPRLANIPGIEKWPGLQMHSHNYRVPEPFQDQVVVIIGHGPSASDISKDIAKVAKEVHMASRSPNVEVSKLETYDNMWQHLMIDCVHEDGNVSFHEGSTVHADIILHCSGYKYNFPFLKTNGILSIEDNRVGPLYKHVFQPHLAPRLSFIGLSQRAIIFLMIELQSKWVALALSGKVVLPSEEDMLASIEEHYRYMDESGIPKHHTHTVHPHELLYLNWLGDQVGLPPLDPHIDDIYMELIKKYKAGTYSRDE